MEFVTEIILNINTLYKTFSMLAWVNIYYMVFVYVYLYLNLLNVGLYEDGLVPEEGGH
jgi:hypothetical protein